MVRTMRLRAVDWVRGLVIALMTIDHAGSRFDSAHMHGDNARHWVVGSPLPAGEFLTRWVTHLCAPTFVLLAGASLAFSDEKRGSAPGQTRFIVTRGLLIAALDPLWMSVGFPTVPYERFIFQVLYAIGISMVCMAWLRKLPTKALLAGGVAIQVGAELTKFVRPTGQPWHLIWTLLFASGPEGNAFVAYPLVPWLSYMMIGWALGRWLLVPRPRRERAARLATWGAGLLALFLLVRGIDGYGNWDLHRDSGAALQWLHVSKYPPSLTFGCLELSIGLTMLAAFVALDDPAKPRKALGWLSLLGSTALFYYVIHVHLMRLADLVLQLDPNHDGLMKTWGAGALTVLVLLAPCAWWRKYKRAHPDGWARYV
jgi:uncharacterized membrane protein